MKTILFLASLLWTTYVAASYGLNSDWRPLKERVTSDFEQVVSAELGGLKLALEDELGLELEKATSADGHFSSWVSADTSFKQCLPALNCGQYDCLQEQYDCPATSFLPNFPVRVCKGFEDDINLGRYDEAGVLWVYQTTYCLQKKAMLGLIDQARMSTPRCQVIEEQIVDRHEECFFEQQKSLCALSFANKKAVLQTLIPHGGRFVMNNNRLDWHRVKILWDHFTRCPLRDIFKTPSQCPPISPASCDVADTSCLQQFATGLNCLLEEMK